MNQEDWFENHNLLKSSIADLLASSRGFLTIEAIESLLPNRVAVSRGDVLSAINGLLLDFKRTIETKGCMLPNGGWVVSYGGLNRKEGALPGQVVVFYDYNKERMLEIEASCSTDGFFRVGEIEKDGNGMFLMTLVKQ